MLDHFSHSPIRKEGDSTKNARAVATGPATPAARELTYAGQLIDFDDDGALTR